MAKREMSKGDILRWLIVFGSDWVDWYEVLMDTWAEDKIVYDTAVEQGDLEERMDVDTWQMRLTKQALNRIKPKTEKPKTTKPK